MNSQDLAPQVVGVARRAPCVEGPAPGSEIGRVEPVGLEGVGVVAGGKEEVALAVEGQRARLVAADIAIHRDPEDDLLRREVQSVPVEREARQPVLGGIAHRRVVKVDPTVLGERGIEGDPQYARLPTATVGLARLDRVEVTMHRQFGGEHGLARVRLPDPDGPEPLDKEHSTIGQHGQLHRIVTAGLQDDFFEGGRLGGGDGHRGDSRGQRGHAGRHDGSDRQPRYPFHERRRGTAGNPCSRPAHEATENPTLGTPTSRAGRLPQDFRVPGRPDGRRAFRPSPQPGGHPQREQRVGLDWDKSFPFGRDALAVVRRERPGLETPITR